MNRFTRQEKTILLLFLLAIVTGSAINLLTGAESSPMNDEMSNHQIRQIVEITETATDNRLGYDSIVQERSLKEKIVGKVHINTASIAELQTIPNIGPQLAKNIVEYRNKNGHFNNIQELTKVKRIGNKTFNKIKSSITL